MDTLSHGLWGSVAFGRQNRRAFWVAFLCGILPDILSFGIYIAGTWLGIFPHPDWSSGRHPDVGAMPAFVPVLYNYTHSLIIFGVVFAGVWLAIRKPYWPLAAWGLHILLDIPTHDMRFFPTPFLWPASDFKVDGRSWGDPVIFIPNLILLVVVYSWYFVARRRRALPVQNNQKTV